MEANEQKETTNAEIAESKRTSNTSVETGDSEVASELPIANHLLDFSLGELVLHSGTLDLEQLHGVGSHDLEHTSKTARKLYMFPQVEKKKRSKTT